MIGATIGGYHILQKLGEGGVGEVYRARDVMLGRDVAVKMLRAELAERDDVRERFRIEARTLASLNHPNIAGMYAFHGNGAVQMMVMELVSGCNLEQHLARVSPGVQDAVELVLQAARGLSYAHQRNIIHRDIKPANLMIDDAGQVKITDFGIARILGAGRLTRHGAVVGTACYIAPEQIRGEQGDARSDIYALAIVLYELLAGRPPFAGGSDYEILRSQVERRPPPLRLCRHDLPSGLEHFLVRALQKKPGQRHQSMNEVIAELSAAREGCLAAVHRSGHPVSRDRTIRPDPATPSRKRLLAFGVAGTLMAVAGAFPWISPLATSTGAAPELRLTPVLQPASSGTLSSTPEEERSVQPVSTPREAPARQPEPDGSAPVPERHHGESGQEAEAPGPEQPRPARPPTEISAPPVPEPVVQPLPVPGPLVPAEPSPAEPSPAEPSPAEPSPAEPSPAGPPNTAPTGRSKAATEKPLAGPALAGKRAQPCSSSWSIHWHGTPRRVCAR